LFIRIARRASTQWRTLDGDRLALPGNGDGPVFPPHCGLEHGYIHVQEAGYGCPVDGHLAEEALKRRVNAVVDEAIGESPKKGLPTTRFALLSGKLFTNIFSGKG